MKIKISLALSALLIGTYAFASPLFFSEPEILSNKGEAALGDGAFKSKLVRLGNGLLISTFGQSQATGQDVYDLKGDSVRQARDIFVRSCMPTPTNDQCAHQANWTEAVNVSNTAMLSSMNTRWQETPEGEVIESATPFYGDSGKPNIFNAGSVAVISWTDKYCPGDEQRMISYNERGGITVPFSCIYTARADYSTVTAGETEPVWTKEQLTTGVRDAMQDVNKGVSRLVNGVATPHWILTWQEDPHGLQIGGGDGPGDGASGANVTHGTDIWYTFSWNVINAGFNKPRTRITNNYTSDGAGGNTSPIYHPSAPDTEIIELERGNTGASRANAALVVIADDVNPDTAPRTVIAYEETKGADRLDSGKFVRYHQFEFNRPPVSQGEYLNGEPGYIISDPAENSRRVRFVTQVKPGAKGMKMGIFWRQGNAVEGGPGDIMVRLGFKPEGTTNAWESGLRPQEMVPAVDPNANAIDYAAASLINNAAALNISSNTVPWDRIEVPDALPTNNLTDATDLNDYEDARAHRAAIRGDDFYIGYTYARDWAVATYTDMDNYNFWFRRYNSDTTVWTDASNLSNIDRLDKLHVKEPRLVGMPGSMPNCATVPENCQDKDAVLLAWGTETNVYAHIGGSNEGDIVYTISKDKGDTYAEPLVVVPYFTPPVDDDANPDTPDYYPMNRFESQLRSTPAGNIVFSVWNENRNDIDASVTGLSVSEVPVTTLPEVAQVPDHVDLPVAANPPSRN